MSNKVEQLLNGVPPVRRDFLKGMLVTGALAGIALPASTVLVPTEASAQSKTAAKGDAKAPGKEASKDAAGGGAAPAPAKGGGGCTPSAVPTCNPQDPASFDVCDNGKIITRKCAAGTKCDKGFCVAAPKR